MAIHTTFMAATTWAAIKEKSRISNFARSLLFQGFNHCQVGNKSKTSGPVINARFHIHVFIKCLQQQQLASRSESILIYYHTHLLIIILIIKNPTKKISYFEKLTYILGEQNFFQIDNESYNI